MQENVNLILGLNPFEIRAGLKPDDERTGAVRDGLNPFEIRAGLKHRGRHDGRWYPVLIPLKSGLA